MTVTRWQLSVAELRTKAGPVSQSDPMIPGVLRLAVATICLALVTLSASAAVLILRLEKTPVSISTPQGDSLLRTTFADEPIRGTIRLTVGVIPGLTATDENTAALRTLDADSWFNTVHIEVSENGEEFHDLPASNVQIIGHSAEQVNPSAATKSGEVRTLEASIEISGLESGDYRLRAEIRGLRSKADGISVRTGQESPELKSAWFARRALRATTWEEYQSVQLERAKIDPDNYRIFLDLANRSLRDGSLEQSTSYFNRTIDLLNKAFDREVTNSREGTASLTDERNAAVRPYRDIVRVLPEYYHDRQRLVLVPEFSTSKIRYVLKERSSGRVLRVVTEMGN